MVFRMNTVAIDIEAYEHDQRCVLEIGLAVKRGYITRLAQPLYEYGDLVIEEHMHYRNGEYVEDNRDNIRFGRSEIVSLSEATRIVDTICGQARTVIFHAASRDLDWLDSIGVDTASFRHVADTQDLARELNAPLGLEGSARHLRIPANHLLNAGNDSACTLKVFFKLRKMEEEQQLEEKCPNCRSTDHSVPTTECMGVYFTDWGTMDNICDDGYGAYLHFIKISSPKIFNN